MAKHRGIIERDYEELIQELGLGHFEGRNRRRFHHHATLSIAAYGLLVAERNRFCPLPVPVILNSLRPGPGRQRFVMRSSWAAHWLRSRVRRQLMERSRLDEKLALPGISAKKGLGLSCAQPNTTHCFSRFSRNSLEAPARLEGSEGLVFCIVHDFFTLHKKVM